MVTTATNYDDMRPIKPDKLDWEVCRTLGVHSMADGGRWTCSLCDWFTPLGHHIPMSWMRPVNHLMAAHNKAWGDAAMSIYRNITGDDVAIPEDEFLRSIGQTTRRTTLKGYIPPKPKEPPKPKKPKRAKPRRRR